MSEQRPAIKPGRTLRDAARYGLGVVVGVVVLVLLFGRRGDLLAAWRQLGQLRAGWVVAGVLAEGLSLAAFGFLQQRVLRLSGARLGFGGLFLVTLANDALACTVPGEPAVSGAYRYNFYRRGGASGASAGWTVFTILIAQAIAMSLLLLLGVLVALVRSTSAADAGLAVLGLIIVVTAASILARRDLVLRMASSLVRACRRVTGRPRGRAGGRVEATLARMREIPLSAPATAGVVAIAFAVWFGDFLCLLCGFGAVHAAIPWGGVLLAYGAAQVVGTLPIVPGGIGIVEGSLAVILVAYGTGRVPAVSVALAYRMVNFWLAIAVGWISFGVLANRARRLAGRQPDAMSGADLPAAAALPPD